MNFPNSEIQYPLEIPLSSTGGLWRIEQINAIGNKLSKASKYNVEFQISSIRFEFIDLLDGFTIKKMELLKFKAPREEKRLQ